MIKKENGVIYLDGTIQDCLNFNSPDLSDTDFIATLIEQLIKDDAGVRVGSSARYREYVKEDVAEQIVSLVRTSDLSKRNEFITAAYEACANSQPDRVNECRAAWRASTFLQGSDIAQKYTPRSAPSPA